ncbi:Rieske 2Fe-2S domain-containing protein [Nostoc sphaeroides]|nr:Rieske 2Fe-2S domain-containing protein [Nostoc sphaeroides]
MQIKSTLAYNRISSDRISISQSEISLETLCSLYPKNSGCQNYIPGSVALDKEGKQIDTNALLTIAKPGIPIFVKGLPDNSVDYLIIQDGPKIAEYAINPICTHLGCTVEWDLEKNHFICPCHGSQYDSQGRAAHGPAKRSLPLITIAGLFHYHLARLRINSEANSIHSSKDD